MGGSVDHYPLQTTPDDIGQGFEVGSSWRRVPDHGPLEEDRAKFVEHVNLLRV